VDVTQSLVRLHQATYKPVNQRTQNTRDFDFRLVAIAKFVEVTAYEPPLNIGGIYLRNAVPQSYLT
jgi:hypothetical protein